MDLAEKYKIPAD